MPKSKPLDPIAPPPVSREKQLRGSNPSKGEKHGKRSDEPPTTPREYKMTTGFKKRV